MVSRLEPRDHDALGGCLRRGRMSQIAQELRESVPGQGDARSTLPIRSLSGGNQQKVAIAAAIVKRPEVLVLEEPTRGVDIGSKAEIYRLMREYAQTGHAVIIYCTEVPEVFEAADLVYVVSDGRLSEPILVMNHADVESLARAITRLERHGAAGAGGQGPARQGPAGQGPERPARSPRPTPERRGRRLRSRRRAQYITRPPV